MQHDQAHAIQHALLHPVDNLVADLVMRHMPPPGEHIGIIEYLLRQAVLWFIQRGGFNVEAIGRQALCQRSVYPVRIDRGDVLIAFFVSKLMPNSYAYCAHRFPLAVSLIYLLRIMHGAGGIYN